ncbi:mavicyanin [Andrographis paniculata]|uniref:mavicyanin n=1 Tax=Andrographis paniculata TaxID=175694 RepID=UPI0021E7C6EC|nr:mavicyanin [Andrographis paniculata]
MGGGYYSKRKIGGIIVAAVLLLFGSETAVMAAKHVVGGSSGWDESTDFNSWASAQTFRVGDELEFKYSAGLHSVVELGGESAFKSCDVGGSGLKSYTGGSDTIKLTKTGTRYFACGTSGHCDQGMKVKITTVAADAPPTSSTTPTTSTSSSTTPPAASSSSSSSASSHHLIQFNMGSLVLIASSLIATSLLLP